jgi:hypothetical protein
MQLVGMNPTSVSFVNVLPACAHVEVVREGEQIHGCATRRRFESEVIEGGRSHRYLYCEWKWLDCTSSV